MSLDTCTVDTSEWVGSDDCTVGDTGCGLFAEQIPSTGQDGPALLFPWLQPGDTGAEVSLRIISAPAGLNLDIYDDSSAIVSASAQGIYTAYLQGVRNWQLIGAPQPATFNFGQNISLISVSPTEPNDTINAALLLEVSAAVGVTEPNDTISAALLLSGKAGAAIQVTEPNDTVSGNLNSAPPPPPEVPTQHMRMIYDNAADRATLTASSTAGTLAAANLKTDSKGKVWRSTGATATLTATWSQLETIGGAVLATCNLEPGDTIRLRGYTNTGDAIPAVDTGAVDTLALGGAGNAAAYEGANYARAWCAQTPVRKLVIDINSTGNPAGYIEAARLIAGAYWSPENDTDRGMNVTPQDASAQYRTQGGTLCFEAGAKYKELAVPLSLMTPADRAMFWKIVNRNGKTLPLFVSIFPESDDAELEQAHQAYCALTDMPSFSSPYFRQYAASASMVEV